MVVVSAILMELYLLIIEALEVFLLLLVLFECVFVLNSLLAAVV